MREEPTGIAKKKGSIAGAVALIIGTSIGSGILALPQKAYPAVLSKSLFWSFVFGEVLLKTYKSGMKEKHLKSGFLSLPFFETIKLCCRD